MLRNREDSTKKSFTGRLCRTLFSVFSQFDLGQVSQMWIFIELSQPCRGFHTSVASCFAHCSSLLYNVYFRYIEAGNRSFLPMQLPLPPPPWKEEGGSVCGTPTGLSCCWLDALERTESGIYTHWKKNFAKFPRLGLKR